jgi:prepilin-type processing-associated H-X9-DG protein
VWSNNLQHSRERAEAQNCLSNLKQLSLGIKMYASDNDDHLPRAENWPKEAFPYLKNSSIYVCPADQGFDRETERRERRGEAPFIPSGSGPARKADWVLEWPLQHPSYTMNLSASGASVTQAGPKLPLLFDGVVLSGDHAAAAYRHYHGLNVGFADGHARWESQEDFDRARFTP